MTVNIAHSVIIHVGLPVSAGSTTDIGIDPDDQAVFIGRAAEQMGEHAT
jgi:hypothetical protein